MTYNLYIFSIGSFLFIGFAFNLLLTKYGNQYLNKLLGIIMLTRGFQMLYYVFVTTENVFFISCLFKTLNPFFFAIPGCTYLYIRGFIKNETQMQHKDWLHFIPVLLAIVDILPWYMLNPVTKEEFISKIINDKLFFINDNFGFISNVAAVLLRSIMLSIYLLFCWRMVVKHKIIEKRKSNPVATNWILVILSIFTLVNINFLSTSIFNHIFSAIHANSIYNNYNFPLFGVAIIVMILFVFYNPKILYGYIISNNYIIIEKEQNLTAINLKQKLITPNHVTNKKIIKNPKSTILAQNQKLFMVQIINFMETNRPYLNPDFSLNILSQKTNIPLHYCSHIINYGMQQTFREWVNGYRIAYFIEQYHLHSKSKTILGLSIESGFKNKVTFYNAFMKEKGVLPTNYFKV